MPSQKAMIDVCLVSKYFYPTPAGGAERFRRYAPGLRERGVHLRIITQQTGNLPSVDILDGLPIIRLPIKDDNQKSSTLLLRGALEYFDKSKEYPDVLQVFSVNPHSTPYLLRTRLRGIPCISVSTMMKKTTSNNKTLYESMKTKLSVWLSYLFFNCNVVSSELMRRSLVDVGVGSRPIKLIPNGVDTNLFHPLCNAHDREKLRSILGFKSDDKIILFVGTISSRKGADLIIDAWSWITNKYPQARLVLVGEIHHHVPRIQEYYASLIENITKSPAPERVVFLGFIPDIHKYYMVADLFVFPSRHEGWPNAVAEAMATRLPCVLTPFEGLSEDFGFPNEQYLLARHDPVDLANTVINLLTDSKLRHRLGKAARLWAETNLGIDKTLDQYAVLYHQLAEQAYKHILGIRPH